MENLSFLIRRFAQASPNNGQFVVVFFKWLTLIVYGILTVIYIMQYVHMIVSLFYKGKKWKKAKTKHTYGYLICGRNESVVIGNLIESIYLQNYDKDKMHVFVCADNCTDNTAEIARSKGAIVYERNNKNEIGKSYALEFLINNVKQNELYKDIEAFFIFDADNLLSPNYTLEMNNLFDAGVKVSTSFRESKNYDSSWVSACSSLTFYRECLLVHNSKMLLNEGTYVSGTGFYIAKDVFEMFDGWPFRTMTEDIEFSIWCNLNNIKVAFCRDAVFYDEQPISLKLANKQRTRWCKGTHQCCARYDKRIVKKFFKSKDKLGLFELFGHITPFPIIAFTYSIINLIVQSIFYFTKCVTLDYYLNELKFAVGGLFIFTFLVAFIQALICTFMHHKEINCSIGRQIWYSFLFPFYVFVYIPLSIKALFSKVTWTPIPHTVDKKI